MLWYNGTMHRYKQMMTRSDMNRFESKFDKTDGCWLWKGSLVVNGYGRFRPHGKSQAVNAHRISYDIYVGRIPSGKAVDHLCRVRGCVNPSHLEPVSRNENTMRGEGAAARNARKTSCLKGHLFTPQNTYIRQTGERTCRACYKLRTGSELTAPGGSVRVRKLSLASTKK